MINVEKKHQNNIKNLQDHKDKQSLDLLKPEMLKIDDDLRKSQSTYDYLFGELSLNMSNNQN